MSSAGNAHQEQDDLKLSFIENIFKLKNALSFSPFILV